MPAAARYDLSPYRPIALDDLVRVGRDYDGGYVISRRTLAATRVLVGLGINDDWSFEAAFVRANPRVRVVGVDGSVSAEAFAARGRSHLRHAAYAAVRQRDFTWARQALRLGRHELATGRALARFFDGRPHRFVPRYFAPADRPDAVSWSTLAREHDVLGGAGGPCDGPCDVFVKMDIEGAEYDTLAGVIADAERLSGVVFEAHDLDRRWDEFAALMELLLASFAVVHLHPNNCAPLVPGTTTPSVLEVSLVSRRLLAGVPGPASGPYPLRGLDMPCDPRNPDYPLVL